ncbi:hypothetical protein ACFPBZ_22035 [Actinomycetospora atypica]|uniref:Uncharacterized protein n=2 Tax=Actinomycetospora atypica TaxID=1290095 RepID=A0ABV9YPR8_9PSEU
MPDPTPRTSTPPRGGVTTTDATTEEKAPASGPTLPQIMAGALAAATAAILGSFLGVIGTIGGAAAASVISTVGTALYQRSLERTRDAVKSRLVVNQVAGSKVATAVAKVAGGGAPPAPRTGRPQGPVAPMGQAPMSPPYGAPMPGRPGPMPPGAPTQRMPGGPQQLRAGGRTVTTRLDPAGRPVAEDHTRRIPDARTPDGRPTQVVPPLGPDGRPMAGPTARMPLGPPSPPGGAPTAYLGGPGPGDDPTRMAPAAEEPTKRRFGWKTYATLAGVAASIFAIGLLASFAVESATGHPLSGGTSGTSVGAIFGQNTEAPPTSETSAPEESDSSDAPTTTSADSGTEDGEQATQAPSSTTRAPATTTPRNGVGNPLPSVLPRFNEQGGATGN